VLEIGVHVFSGLEDATEEWEREALSLETATQK